MKQENSFLGQYTYAKLANWKLEQYKHSQEFMYSLYLKDDEFKCRMAISLKSRHFYLVPASELFLIYCFLTEIQDGSHRHVKFNVKH